MVTLELVVVKVCTTFNYSVVHGEELYKNSNQFHALGVTVECVERGLDGEGIAKYGPGAIWYLQCVILYYYF